MGIFSFAIGLLTGFADRYGLNIVIIIILVYGGIKLFTNHLAHLKKSIENIDKTTTDTNEKIDKIDKRVTVIETRCAERHK